MNVARLRALRLEPPALEPHGPADNLRRRFDAEWDERRAVELGESSPYATSASTRALVTGAGVRAEAAPRCGDCGAIRSARGDCRACGSSQPASLAAMNPRAARMIGQQPYR